MSIGALSLGEIFVKPGIATAAGRQCDPGMVGAPSRYSKGVRIAGTAYRRERRCARVQALQHHRPGASAGKGRCRRFQDSPGDSQPDPRGDCSAGKDDEGRGRKVRVVSPFSARVE